MPGRSARGSLSEAEPSKEAAPATRRLSSAVSVGGSGQAGSAAPGLSPSQANRPGAVRRREASLSTVCARGAEARRRPASRSLSWRTRARPPTSPLPGGFGSEAEAWWPVHSSLRLGYFLWPGWRGHSGLRGPTLRESAFGGAPVTGPPRPARSKKERINNNFLASRCQAWAAMRNCGWGITPKRKSPKALPIPTSD